MKLPRLREWREAQGLTQRELAARADVSDAVVPRVERGDATRPNTARKLAGALDVEVVDLMENPPTPAPKAPAPTSSLETAGTGLLAKAKDAVRRDSRLESQAIQRAHESEGPQTVSGYEEDQFRAELRSLDFEHIFEKVLWPAVQEAVEADQLREEVARLSEEVARLREVEDYASRD
jgi:transcriptional regulator with XRE-family HTH domain